MGFLAAAAVSIVVLSGCGSSAQSDSSASEETTPTPTPTVTTPPADGGSFSSLADFQQAYIAAGGDCSGLDFANSITLAAESGNCNDQTVISTYISSADVSELIQKNKALNEALDSDSDTVWLTGQNWVLNSPDAAAMQEKMGGRLVRF